MQFESDTGYTAVQARLAQGVCRMIEELRTTPDAAIVAPVAQLGVLLPLAQWLTTSQPSWLLRDALAGLPPEYGIYCYLVGGLFHAVFGSSRQLAF